MEHYVCKTVKPENTDMNLYEYGCEKCVPGHAFGPAIRDHYLIHYIAEGQGTYQVGKNIYHLQKGQGFLICPNVLTYYQADNEKPWQYYWIGFHGLKAKSYLDAAGLNMEHPIFNYNSGEAIINCFEQLFLSSKLTNSKDTFQIGQLYLFLSLIIENMPIVVTQNSSKSRKEQYINNAMYYVQRNYSRKVSIADLADYLNLDRSYFTALFKEYTNISPQNYLINYRIDKSCEFMENSSLSIGDIARSVGYGDALVFSKVFKKIKGSSPKEYRKSINYK